MKVKLKNPPKPISFDNINVGEIFEWNSVLWMKTNNFEAGGRMQNSVSLNGKSFQWFTFDVEVLEKDSELVVD